MLNHFTIKFSDKINLKNWLKKTFIHTLSISSPEFWDSHVPLLRKEKKIEKQNSTTIIKLQQCSCIH